MSEDRYALLIREHWAKHGYKVKVEVRDIVPKTGGYAYRAVRSNIVNGLPRDFKRTSAIIIDKVLIG